MERTATDISVKVRDLSNLKDKTATEVSNKLDQPVDSVQFDGPWATLKIENNMYAVCSEGVSTVLPITDDRPLKLPVRSVNEDGGIGFAPIGKQTVSRTMLEQCPVVRNENLDDFIDDRGSERLDKNYEKVRRLFEAESNDEPGYSVLHQTSDSLVQSDFCTRKQANAWLDEAVSNGDIRPNDKDEYAVVKEQKITEDTSHGPEPSKLNDRRNKATFPERNSQQNGLEHYELFKLLCWGSACAIGVFLLWDELNEVE